ncbi:MAG: SCP2 sterol-binding domain-containing protein [Candidatus Njordarchaeia archaeon]
MPEEYEFMSPEWVKAIHESVNNSEEYEKAAKNWEGDILFVATDLPPNVSQKFGGKEKIGFWLDLWHGKSRGYEFVEDVESKKPEFVISSTYENWKKVVKGDLNPVSGLMTRKLKVKGSLAKILRHTNAAIALLKAVQKVPTKFIDE